MFLRYSERSPQRGQSHLRRVPLAACQAVPNTGSKLPMPPAAKIGTVPRDTPRQGLTLIELLIASAVMAMTMAALAALGKAVQVNAAYGDGHGQAVQHARVAIERITRMAREATASPSFPGFLVLAEVEAGWRFPDTVVIWHPSGSPVDPNGLPRFNELIIYCPDPEDPHRLVEITAPSDTRTVPAVSDLASWASEIDGIKNASSSEVVMLTDLMRSCPVGTGFRGAVRFESRLRPSAEEWTSYQAGDLDLGRPSLGPGALRLEDGTAPGVAADRAAVDARGHGDRRRPRRPAGNGISRLRGPLLPDAPMNANLGEPATLEGDRSIFRPTSFSETRFLAEKWTSPRPRDRRGMSVLIVILLIALTMGVSYSILRSQATGLHIQQNAGRQSSARAAAVTGLVVAVKRMHAADWGGASSSFAESLGEHERFQATFSPGDPTLAAADSDYADYPYRVTIVSTGFAENPASPDQVSTYRIRAVMQLVPRQAADEPSDWTRMQGYTVYQTKNDSFEIDIPCRIEGSVRVQGGSRSPSTTRIDSDALAALPRRPQRHAQRGRRGLPAVQWARASPLRRPGPTYLLGPEARRWACRPTITPVREAAADWVQPTGLTAYQIYPGGPSYAIPTVPSPLENTTLEPDALTNPLGIRYRSGTVTIKNNVTIRGSLFCSEDIVIEGTNVRFQPVDLPGLYGSSQPLRLPVASCRDFDVKATAGGSLTGLLAVFDDFLIEKSPATVTFAFTGRVITKKFYIKERTPWETLNWGSYYESFAARILVQPRHACLPTSPCG